MEFIKKFYKEELLPAIKRGIKKIFVNGVKSFFKILGNAFTDIGDDINLEYGQ